MLMQVQLIQNTFVKMIKLKGMKKIIPPFLFLFCILIMVTIRNLIVLKEIIPNQIKYAGIAIIIVGILITIIVRKGFEKINIEIHTFKKPRKLVTNGLFKFSRNPIYLGFTISLIGVWVLLGTILPIIGILIFIVVTNNYYIPYEGKIMEKVFGNEYKEYKSKVRRWI